MECSKISAEITDLIDEIVANEGFKNAVVNVQNIKTKGGNFLGELYSVDITETGKKHSLFLKVAPNNPESRALLNLNSAYKNEIFTYTKLKNCFTKLQNDFNITGEESYRFAEFFGYRNKQGSEVIVLENLKLIGYQTHDRMKPINTNYMLKAIKTLAKFHALSIAAKQYEPEFFEKEIVTKCETVFTYYAKNMGSEVGKPHFDEIFENVLKAVKHDHRTSLKKWYTSNESKNIFNNTFHTKRGISVLCHGDYRTENIMVKSDKNDVVTSMIAVDFQLVFYGSPATDLLYLIFTATPTKLRRENLNSWIDYYYTQLRNSLKIFSIDLEDIYPKEVYEKDVNDTLPYGLYIAVNILHFMLTDPNDVGDIGAEELMSKDKNYTDILFGSKLYKERISGIVEDFVNSGYLDGFT